jgi:ferrochelatase
MEVRTGVLLVNLGTPDSPQPRDVRRYLREFLSDPRVIDLPAPARWLLLHAVILPFRPRASARAYQQIWTPAGSPLLLHGRALQAALASTLGDAYVVELGMRYGNPSLREALSRLNAADVVRILALPLFPQHSEAARESAIAKLASEVARAPETPPVETLPPFYDERRFVAAVASVSKPRLETIRPDFVLMSYHGLPERQVRAGDRSGEHCLVREDCCDAVGSRNRDCYRAQCFATTRAVAAALDLAPGGYATSFQSRLGRTPWIRPYTDEVLADLAARGVRRLAVLCPSFVADCLETLEEIAIRGRERWLELGGEALEAVPCVNAAPAWVDAVARWIRERA